MEIVLHVDSALKHRCKIRKVGPGGKYFEFNVPREIIEREADKRGMTLDLFLKSFEVEALYDSFDGIYYRFVPKG